MHDMVPKLEDPNVNILIAEIRNSGGGLSSDAAPVFVDVRPEENVAVNDCFPIVDEKIQKFGGERILGWTLRHEIFLMSAEFHAVWKSPQGELLDITPKEILMPGDQNIVVPTDRIMFVAALHAKYEDKQVCNININISDSRLVDDIIDCNKCIFNIHNKGDRASQYGEIELSMQESKDMIEIQNIVWMLKSMYDLGIKSKRCQCFCRSGDSYKHCHGKILNKIIKRNAL